MKNFYIIKKSRSIVEIRDSQNLHSDDYSEEFVKFVNAEIHDLSKQKLEKSNKPEYLKIANKLGFNWEDNSDIGFPRYDYKAAFIMELIKSYAEKLVNEIGFPIYRVQGSNVFDLRYPVVEAYAKLFGGRLFKLKSGQNDLVLSYDASYPQFNLAAKSQLSYKNMPYAHFSISDCYRNEQSGECMLLYRSRRFYMPDLHPYFMDINQAFEWYPKIEAVIVSSAKSVNSEYQMSIEVASERQWVKYRNDILNIAQHFGKDVLCIVNQDKKDRYWVVNIDYKIVDSLGQSREISCIQIDIGNAKRMGIEYINQRGEKCNPVIIHSAVSGGIERYIYMALDKNKEKLPLWINPIQLRLLPVNKNHLDYCMKLAKSFHEKLIRVDIDDREISIGKKVMCARDELVGGYFVIGDKELNSEGNFAELMEFVDLLRNESQDMPKKMFSWPFLLRKRIV